MADVEAASSFQHLRSVECGNMTTVPALAASQGRLEGDADVFHPDAGDAMLEQHPLFAVYKDAATERHYAQFLTTRRALLTVMCVAGGLALAGLIIRYQSIATWMGALNAATAIVLEVVAAVNYVQCIRGSNSIKNALLHEALVAVALIALVSIPATRYELIKVCARKMGDKCLIDFVDAYCILIALVPCVLFAVRPLFVAPPLLLHLVALAVFPPLDDFRMQRKYGLFMFVMSVITFFAIVINFAFDHQARRRFEVWVHLRRATAELDARREAVRGTLKNLLPESVMDNIRADRPMVESAEQCSVAAMCIHDFHRWTWRIQPQQVMVLVSALVTLGEDGLGRFGVDRLRVVGDLYVVSSGLRQQRTPRQSAGNCVRFALMQQQRLCFVSTVFSLPSFKTQFGVGSGKCSAGFVGVRSLWYEGFGEALDVALQLMRHCPPGAVLACGATRDYYGNLFVDEPVVGSQPPSFLVDSERAIGLAHAPNVPNDDAPPAPEPPRLLSLPQGGPGAQYGERLQQLLQTTAVVERDVSAEKVREVAVEESTVIQQSRFDYLRACVRAAHGSQSSVGAAGPVAVVGPSRGAARNPLSAVDGVDPFFDHEQLAALSAELQQPRVHWWLLAFPSDELEEQFATFRAVIDRSDGTLMTAFAFTFCVTTLIVFLIEGSHTSASLVFVFLAIAVLGARLFVRAVLQLVLPVWEVALSFVAFCALLLASLATAQPGSLMNEVVDYADTVTTVMCVLWCRRLPWGVSAGIVVVLLPAITVIDHRSGIPAAFFFVIGPLWTLTMATAAYVTERSMRAHFVTALLAEATQRAAHTELLLHRSMLELVVPSFAVKAVEERCKRSGDQSMAAPKLLPDLVVLLVRFDALQGVVRRHNRAPEAILRHIERQFAALDDALHHVRDAVAASTLPSSGRESLCHRIRVSGDEAMLAGPLWPSDCDGDSGKSRGEASFHAVMDLLDVVDALFRQAPRCTAVMTCNDALQSLVGDMPPSVAVVGPGVRTATALLEAAPAGESSALYMSGSVHVLLRNHNVVLPRRSGDLSPVATQRWSLRGAGMQTVHVLRPAKPSVERDVVGSVPSSCPSLQPATPLQTPFFCTAPAYRELA